jgi:DUF177 domain-containing protein
MTGGLVVPVGDLIGAPGKERPFVGEQAVSLGLGQVTVDGPMKVSGRVLGLIDAVRAEFRTSAEAHFTCTRCLVEWDEEVLATGEQYFGRIEDEDGYALVDDAVDLFGPAKDELALSLPAAPLCRPDCAGLCPICGSDLNTDPCGGHGEDSQSPFAALKDLFEP